MNNYYGTSSSSATSASDSDSNTAFSHFFNNMSMHVAGVCHPGGGWAKAACQPTCSWQSTLSTGGSMIWLLHIIMGLLAWNSIYQLGNFNMLLTLLILLKGHSKAGSVTLTNQKFLFASNQSAARLSVSIALIHTTANLDHPLSHSRRLMQSGNVRLVCMLLTV